MKLKFFLLGFVCIILSCKNENKINDLENNSEHEEPTTNVELDSNSNSTPITGTNHQDSTFSGINDKTTTKPPISATKLNPGTYTKVESEGEINCECYCLNVNYSSNSELCLTPGKLFIKARFAPTDTNLINVYYTGPSANSANTKDIPWDKFDKNIPVAIITPISGQEIDLDWLGFSINGDLALDYAILGKKSLEGNYRKK